MTNHGQCDAITAFEREASTYSRRYTGGSPESHGFLTRRRRVLELLDRLPDRGAVLDVGCGPGVMIEALQARGWRYVGIDPAPGMLVESRSRFGDEVSLVQGRIEALPFHTAAFEAVVAMGVLGSTWLILVRPSPSLHAWFVRRERS